MAGHCSVRPISIVDIPQINNISSKRMNTIRTPFPNILRTTSIACQREGRSLPKSDVNTMSRRSNTGAVQWGSLVHVMFTAWDVLFTKYEIWVESRATIYCGRSSGTNLSRQISTDLPQWKEEILNTTVYAKVLHTSIPYYTTTSYTNVKGPGETRDQCRSLINYVTIEKPLIMRFI